MKIVAALSRKGGVGKTSVCMNLAGCMAEAGHRVVLFDLDPQGSAKRWADQASDESPMPFPVFAVELEGARKFKQRIDSAAKETGAEICIVDCPPELREESLTAAMLAELVLIPVSPSALDLWAAQGAVEMCRDARAMLKGDKPRVVLVPSKVSPGTNMARQITETLEAFGEPVGPAIAERIAHRESTIAGQTICSYAPNSMAHREFRQLTDFVFQEIMSYEDV